VSAIASSADYQESGTASAATKNCQNTDDDSPPTPSDLADLVIDDEGMTS
jgi:hypothetical protein